MKDLKAAKLRLKSFLLCLGFRYTGKDDWNAAHLRYLASVTCSTPAEQIGESFCAEGDRELDRPAVIRFIACGGIL